MTKIEKIVAVTLVAIVVLTIGALVFVIVDSPDDRRCVKWEEQNATVIGNVSTPLFKERVCVKWVEGRR